MLCGNCGKREVEVYIKQIVNNETRDISLCRVCAEELGFLSAQMPSITISFSLHEMNAQQANAPRWRKTARLRLKRDEDRYDGLVCPSCGTAYEDFRGGGLLGCAECYQAFRFPLGAKLQQMQGAESHWDGTSKMFSDITVLDLDAISAEQNRKFTREERESGIRKLKEEIGDAVAHEEYERAAELRDRLKPLLEDDAPVC